MCNGVCSNSLFSSAPTMKICNLPPALTSRFSLLLLLITRISNTGNHNNSDEGGK